MLQFLEFIKDCLTIKDELKSLPNISSDEISSIVQQWDDHLSNKPLKKLTVKRHIRYVDNLLKFIEKSDVAKILETERESQAKQLNLVAQAKEEKELIKKSAALNPQGITDESELTALQTKCHECNELRKEINRLKDENEFLRSKLSEQSL